MEHDVRLWRQGGKFLNTNSFKSMLQTYRFSLKSLHFLCIPVGKTNHLYNQQLQEVANEHIKISSNSCEIAKTFKYLGSLSTNQNFIQEEKNVDLKHVII